jgi:porin
MKRYYLCGRRALLAALATVATSAVGTAQTPEPEAQPVAATAETATVPCDGATATLCCDQPAAPALPPYGGPFCERPKLTGDWCGARGNLRDRGITLDADLTQFYQGVATGGIRRDWEYGFKGNYYGAIDGGKLGLWDGLFFNVRGESRVGNDVNRNVGALSPVNLAMLFPGSRDASAITGLTVTQFLSPNVALTAGKINTLDGDVLGWSSGKGIDRFMNGALAFNLALLRAVPYSTYGAGLVVLREGEPVFSFTVLDPVDRTFEFDFGDVYDDGVVFATEARIPTAFGGLPGHYGGGYVYSTRKYAADDPGSYLQLLPVILAGLPVALPRETGSWAAYYKADQAIRYCPDDKSGWGFFSTGGIADGNPNPIRWFVNGGVSGTSPFRKQDTFGAGYYYLGLSDNVKRLFPRANLQDEQGVELFYNIGVTPWCHITPDVQFIRPARGNFDNAIVCGVRAKVDF